MRGGEQGLAVDERCGAGVDTLRAASLFVVAGGAHAGHPLKPAGRYKQVGKQHAEPERQVGWHLWRSEVHQGAPGQQTRAALQAAHLFLGASLPLTMAACTPSSCSSRLHVTMWQQWVQGIDNDKNGCHVQRQSNQQHQRLRTRQRRAGPAHRPAAL